MSPKQEVDRTAVVFISNADAGQINGLLAIAHGILESASDVDVHVISWTGQEQAADQTAVAASRAAGTRRTINYHTIKSGLSLNAGTDRIQKGQGMSGWFHNASLRDHLDIYRRLPVSTMVWTKEEYAEIFFEVLEHIEKIKGTVSTPDDIVLVLDAVITPGVDAAMASGLKMCLVWSVTTKEIIFSDQPLLDILTKHPLPFSCLPYPLPWHLIPLNFLYLAYFGVNIARDETAPSILAHRATLHPAPPPKLPVLHYPGMITLTHSLPELDYPFKEVPKSVYYCGPMVRPDVPLSESDPDLKQWIANGRRTIVINLGTHRQYSDSNLKELEAAVKTLIHQAEDLQILWKVKRRKDATLDLEQILVEERTAGRARVVEWIKPTMLSVLSENGVAGLVNHGGANIWYEGLVAGVPQVVLPAWLDTYDMADRTEYLGNGRWGNKNSCPHWERNELGSVLLDVFVGPKHEKYAEQALRFRDICEKKGPGRDVAARKVLELLREPSKKTTL